MKNEESLSIEKIVLVGAGNVATHLGTALRDAGYAVVQVFSRTGESASALAEKLGCPYTTDISRIVPDAGLYIVSVKDSVLAEVVPPLVRRNPEALFVHTAGSMPMDVWKGEAVRYGVLYPMQTFSKGRAVDFTYRSFLYRRFGRRRGRSVKGAGGADRRARLRSYVRATPVSAHCGGVRLQFHQSHVCLGASPAGCPRLAFRGYAAID